MTKIIDPEWLRGLIAHLRSKKEAPILEIAWEEIAHTFRDEDQLCQFGRDNGLAELSEVLCDGGPMIEGPKMIVTAKNPFTLGWAAGIMGLLRQYPGPEGTLSFQCQSFLDGWDCAKESGNTVELLQAFRLSIECRDIYVRWIDGEELREKLNAFLGAI